MGIYYRRQDTTVLERSIRSILVQSISDLELLICDDGSLPCASNLLEHLASEDARIRFVRRGNLLTLSSKLNACLNQARGQWIARMDDDDYSHPQRIERQLSYLKGHPEIALLGCNANFYRGKQFLGIHRFPEHPAVRDFYFSQPFLHPTLIFCREALMSVHGYTEDKHCVLCEDYDLLLRLYSAGYTGVNLQEPLFDYTVPKTAKGNRRMIHRWNETVTRYRRFHDLGVLPEALPYVLKPLVVGLLPEPVLKRLKRIP